MVNFPTWIPDCDSDSPALFYLFISSNASICSTMAFPPLGNSDHVVVFPLTFHHIHNGMPLFHRIAYDYSQADWDGLGDHLRDIPWEDIFKLSDSAAASEFVSGFRLELMYISLIESIRSSLTNLHRFQLLFCCHNS